MSELPKATARGKKPYKRKLSNYLLNKDLQLRYVAFVTILSAIISGSLGYLIWKQEDRATQAVLKTFDTLVDDAETEADKQTWMDVKQSAASDMSNRDTNLILVMAGVGIGLVLILSLYLVVMTHKVAGPLYKVSSYFDEMAQGRLGDTWPLRKGDMLQDFYEKFKEMHDAVREQKQADNELVGRFLAACKDAGVAREGGIASVLDELEAYKKHRDEALA